MSKTNHPILLSLPDELGEWATQNHELITRIQKALDDTHETLTEDKIWEAVASASSSEWHHARLSLQEAETQWTTLHSPERKPLGAIGRALEFDHIDAAHNSYTSSLADFTIVNEGLRQRQDLSRLFNVLVVQKRMLDASSEQTLNLQSSTARLESIDLGAVPQPSPKVGASENNPGIRKVFGMYARKFLTSAPKESAPKTAPALSSPKI